MSFGTELAEIYRRDLTRLIQQVQAFPDNESLWATLPGVTNGAGNLVLHLDGNLREFVGRKLGNRPFERNRPLEFTSSGLTREELTSRIDKLCDLIASVLESLSDEQLSGMYPEDFHGVPLTARQMLVHLSGHLQWHLGQVDYLRRILTGGRALAQADIQRSRAKNEG